MSFFLRAAFLTALVAWLGAISFFSFVVAPSLFGALPVEAAGRAVGTIFPRYYGLGVIAGCVLMASALALGVRSDTRGRWFSMAGLAAIMLGMTLYASVSVQPRATALREALHAGAGPPPGVRAEFDRLHRTAVLLNGATLVLGIGVLGATASALRH